MQYFKLTVGDLCALSFAVLLGVVLIALTAAMNGGTALAASDFDNLITYLKNNWLLSTFIIFLSMVVLIATIWQLTNGQGLGNASTVLIVLVMGVVGYSVITTAATATRLSMANTYIADAA
jgi:hypothetical protein